MREGAVAGSSRCCPEDVAQLRPARQPELTVGRRSAACLQLIEKRPDACVAANLPACLRLPVCSSVKALQKAGGSGVLVQPMTYIFDEEPERWGKLLDNLGLKPEDVPLTR